MAVSLLSPLTAMKKGANALYISILSACHPKKHLSHFITTFFPFFTKMPFFLIED
jgi:hypothetical protein